FLFTIIPSILFVFSSADKNLVGNPAGYYLPEAAHPYYIFSPSCEIDFGSPKGTFPVNPTSIEGKECIDFLKDETVKAKFAEAKTLSNNPLSIKLASDFYRAGKITAAVCHGTAALAESFTGFSDAEEEALNVVARIPFLLENKITALGGKYEKADELFGVKVVNPNSAGPLAKEILAALNK
ncbi:class I glutamine amidotransferase-like protein, partial [Mycena floridula]